MKIIGIILSVAVVLFSCGTVFAAEEAEFAFKGTTGQLYKEYRDNELAADFAYTGEMVEVTGIVKSVRKASSMNEDKGAIELAMERMPGEEMIIGNVKTYFQNSWTPYLATFKPGDEITVRGECDGLLYGDLIIIISAEYSEDAAEK